MTRETDDYRLNPIVLGAVVAGLIAFVVTGGITVAVWVAAAATVGAGIGWIVHRLTIRAEEYPSVEELSTYASKAELEEEAARLGIRGRSSMSKDELAREITRKLAS